MDGVVVLVLFLASHSRRDTTLQIVIIVLLAIIALAVAPWIVATVVAAAAVYGPFLVTVIVVAITGVVLFAVWKTATSWGRRERITQINGPRKSCPNCQNEVPATATRCMSCGTDC